MNYELKCFGQNKFIDYFLPIRFRGDRFREIVSVRCRAGGKANLRAEISVE